MEAQNLESKELIWLALKNGLFLKKYGLDSPMCNAEINLIDGFNDIKFHDTLIKNYTEMIPLVANAGFKILFALAEIKEIKQTKKD
jgi:hydroxypyruvate isomerase